MSDGERQYMRPQTSLEEQIRALEMERESLERYVEARKGKPWSSGAVNARTRIKGIGHTIERLRSQAQVQGQATNADPRVVRIGGLEYFAPEGRIPAPTPAANAGEGDREREPWRSPPILVRNVAGGRKVTRYEEITGNASNEGREPEYMPIPAP